MKLPRFAVLPVFLSVLILAGGVRAADDDGVVGISYAVAAGGGGRLDEVAVAGLRVAAVPPDSAAAAAGLRAGDVIVAVNGEAVTGETFLPGRPARKAGAKLLVTYVRDGRFNQANLVVRPRPAASVAQGPVPPAAAPGRPAAPSRLTLPLEPAMTARGPVGLFFMTRFWAFTGSLEQAVWYFDGEGRAYLNPGKSFGRADLEQAASRWGTITRKDGKLSVAWNGGKVTESALEPDKDGVGFAWDGGLFSPIRRPADWTRVEGHFEGGASVSIGTGRGSSVSALTLRRDGTFAWSTGASMVSSTAASEAFAGGTSAPREGRWRGDGYQLILRFADGREEAFFSFPWADLKDPGKVGMLFFNGTMHLARPAKP